MKLNEYSIFEIATQLDIPLQGNNFVHNCKQSNKPNALLYENNSFYCKDCGAFGDNKTLIEHFKKFDTEEKLNFWAGNVLNDYESYISLSLQDTTFSENMGRLLGASLIEAEKNGAFHGYMKKEYGFDADDLIQFQVGYVSKDCLISLPDEFVEEHKVKSIIDHFIIPVVQNGTIISAKAFPLDEGHPLIISKPERVPIACFNYNLAKQELTKNKGFTALLYCENELDVLALRKHCNVKTAVTTSQINHITTEEKKQLTELSGLASDTMIVWGELYRFENEPTQASISLIEKGIDIHVLVIPKIGNSLARFVKIATHPAILKEAIREQIHGQSLPFLATYIESNRPQLHKSAIRERICELIAYLPSQTIEIYQKQLSHIPSNSTVSKDPAFRTKVTIPIKTSTQLIKERQREHNKVTAVDIVLSDNKNNDGTQFYAQDYWHNLSDNKLYAIKTVYTKINKTNRKTEEGLMCQRVPIAVKAKANSVGNTSFEFKALDVDIMDDFEQTFLPPFDTLGAFEQWQIHGDSPYCFQSFLQAKGDVDVDTKTLYNDIKTILKEYYYFKNPLYVDIITSYIMMTYVYMLTDAVPYLHIRGKASSGKSLLVDIMNQLCFNSEKFVGANHTHIFRLVHSKRCTLFLNEEEHLGRAGNMRSTEILPLLKDSYSKTGGWVPRFSEGKGTSTRFTMTRYFAYSPKIISGTRRIDSILATRTISIDTQRIPEENLATLKNYNVDKLKLMAQFQDIRNRLMVWSLVDYYRFYTKYLNGIDILRNRKIGNRDLDLWTPIYGVLACVEDEETTLMKIESFTQDMINRRNTFRQQSNMAELVQVFVDTLFEFSEKKMHKDMGIYKHRDPDTGLLEYYFVKDVFFRKFQNYLELKLVDNYLVLNRYQTKGDIGMWSRRENEFGRCFVFDTFFRDIPKFGYKRNRQIKKLNQLYLQDLAKDYSVNQPDPKEEVEEEDLEN